MEAAQAEKPGDRSIPGWNTPIDLGYGVSYRTEAPYAISRLSPAEVDKAAGTMLEDLLERAAPGVRVTRDFRRVGAPGAVHVRGLGSVLNTEPLYVVDGLPLWRPLMTSGYGETTLVQGNSPLALLAPGEIASITVLKDASAALYGVRGGSGVVLIETKRGETGPPRLHLSVRAGPQQPGNRLDLLNAAQFVDYANRFYAARGISPHYYGYPGDGVENEVELDPDVDNDWMDQLYRAGSVFDGTLSLSGGSDVPYYLSGSYLEEHAPLQGQHYRRFGIRFSAVDVVPGDRLSIGVQSAFFRGQRQGTAAFTAAGTPTRAVLLPPICPARSQDISYPLSQTCQSRSFLLPPEQVGASRSAFDATYLFASLSAQYRLTSALRLQGRATMNRWKNSGSSDIPMLGPEAVLRESLRQDNQGALYELLLRYETTAGRQHAFRIVSGISTEPARNRHRWIREHLATLDVDIRDGETTTVTSATYSEEEYESRVGSLIHQARYAYGERYTVELLLRGDRYGDDDGVSFSDVEGRRWYPALALGWDVGNEAFFRRQRVLDALRLRGSYGTAGRLLGREPERTTQLNLGVDLALWHERLAVRADYYVKETRSDLFSYTFFPDRVFEDRALTVIENRGLDVQAEGRLIETRSFRWTTSLQAATNRNTVIRVEGPLGRAHEPGTPGAIVEGAPYGVFYGYRADGERRTEYGARLYADLNGDGQVDEEDQTLIGNPWPDWTGNLESIVGLGSFDVSARLRFSVGGQVFSETQRRMEGAAPSTNRTTDVLDEPSLEVDEDAPPQRVDPFTQPYDRLVEDASYVRLHELTLGYAASESVCRRLRLHALRVYARAQNLWTLTGYSGADPAVYSHDAETPWGVDAFSVAPYRSFSVGVRVTL